ncbi:MAG: DUF1800 family protein [Actinobacteria bacterium]|uniref:Unannotated protein n=1 Tax=freshwater metagenome TaxID=449393 RepID=A0A6J6QDN7_9ZZZZ|nr:DUF1800 family protein [Actinomycetota bacterium]
MSTTSSEAPAGAPTAVPSEQARHLLSRFTAGPTPALARTVAGSGHLRWFEEQLSPDRIADPAGDQVDTWWPDLARTPLDLWQRNVEGVRSGYDVMRDYAAWQLTRRLVSQRQVHETMTEFFENLLHVPATSDGQFTWRARYGQVVRKHALGRYDHLLNAAIVHPAMLIYLNGATSTKTAPNENLGRELLELHTVGAGNYSESDVKDSARILTGWRVDLYDTWQRLYVPEYHATGVVKVKGFRDPNRSADGRAVLRRYLTYLAHHPATARRIAERLVTKFVSDSPAPALVDELAQVYLRADTRIVPVLQALVRSPQVRGSVGAKLRDPNEDVLASFRAMQVSVEQPVDTNSATAVMVSSTGSLGLVTSTWPRPDGAPLSNEAWSSPLRALASVGLHWSLANRSRPTAQVVHRDPLSWLPPLPASFREVVDHVSRTLLYRPATSALVGTCVLATGVTPDTEITADHPFVVSGIPRLLAALLDTPEHYAR